MNFEDMQRSWQSQAAGTQITINSDLLLKEVRRNQQQFRATIFLRDVREVGIAFLVIPVFLYGAIRWHDWTYYLVALGCLFVGLFIVVDRLKQRRKRPTANETVKACAETSLAEVSHQIWLLKNVAWWYLLPIAVPLGINVSRFILDAPQHRLVFWGGYAVFCILLFWAIYHLNQFAVRRGLEPRRRELETLVSSLNQ